MNATVLGAQPHGRLLCIGIIDAARQFLVRWQHCNLRLRRGRRQLRATCCVSRLSVECTRTASPASRAATSLLQFGLVRILARTVRVQLNVLIAAALAGRRRIGGRARFHANIAGLLLNRGATATTAANTRRTGRRRTGRDGGRRRPIINRTARVSTCLFERGFLAFSRGHRGHAQYSCIAHAIAAGDGWLRVQTEHAHLAHIAIAIAHPHIVLGAQCR